MTLVYPQWGYYGDIELWDISIFSRQILILIIELWSMLNSCVKIPEGILGYFMGISPVIYIINCISWEMFNVTNVESRSRPPLC
jgi:hypothetical protein